MATGPQDRGRQNVLVMVGLQLEGGTVWRASLRNISAGGARLIAPVVPDAGSQVVLDLPNVGQVEAQVVWARPQQGCFGVQFAAEVDPAAVRQRITGSYAIPPEPPPPVQLRVA